MKSSFGIYSKSNNLTNKEGNAITKSKRFNSSCRCTHQIQFMNRAQDHKWKGFSWPLLRNAVRMEGKTKKGWGRVGSSPSNLGWKYILHNHGPELEKHCYRTELKRKIPYINLCIHVKSLRRTHYVLKPINYGSKLLWFLTCIRKMTGLTQEI